MTDERILKKIGKLLKLYGVEDEDQIQKFLNDVEDKKYDEDEEEAETPVEEKQVDEEKVELEEKPEKTEEVVESEEKVEEEPSLELEESEDEEATETEETEVENEPLLEEEPQQEQVVEGNEEEVGGEEPEEKAAYDFQAKIEELEKTNEGLSARISTLEDIVAKLGVEEPDQTMGASPNGNPVNQEYNSAFDEINRKRVG